MKRVISFKQIIEKIEHNAKDIAAYVGGFDQKIAFITVLKGAVNYSVHCSSYFTNHLMEYVIIRSYSGTASHDVQKYEWLFKPEDLNDYPTIIVLEDIFDTGNTLNLLTLQLRKWFPNKTIKTSVLVRRIGSMAPIQPDWSAISMEDGFIIGFGMDYNERYRNLTDIFMLESGDDPNQLNFTYSSKDRP